METESFETANDNRQFEQRKVDHIRLALDSQSQTPELSGLNKINLLHEALPEIDFSEVDLRTFAFEKFNAIGGLKLSLSSPMFVSSMTAGHTRSKNINLTLARVCENKNWAMGVGSQRRELTDPAAAAEWKEIRKQCPRVVLFGNIGLSQLIQTSTEQVLQLADNLQASAMIVHTNPLQECLQPEGTPQFAGGLKAIERLCREIDIPVILKETGCGFSEATLRRLDNISLDQASTSALAPKAIGLAAVDVSGLGGTHWGRVEGGRSVKGEKLNLAAQSFANWGINTVESVLNAVKVKPNYEVWASGGVRSGLDAAKLLALGAQMIGLAQPLMQAALEGEAALSERMTLLDYELKMALFCTGSKSIREFQEKQAWAWEKT